MCRTLALGCMRVAQRAGKRLVARGWLAHAEQAQYVRWRRRRTRLSCLGGSGMTRSAIRREWQRWRRRWLGAGARAAVCRGAAGWGACQPVFAAGAAAKEHSWPWSECPCSWPAQGGEREAKIRRALRRCRAQVCVLGCVCVQRGQGQLAAGHQPQRVGGAGPQRLPGCQGLTSAARRAAMLGAGRRAGGSMGGSVRSSAAGFATVRARCCCALCPRPPLPAAGRCRARRTRRWPTRATCMSLGGSSPQSTW